MDMHDGTGCRFGDFKVDLEEHELRHDRGQPVPLSRRSFALLATFLSRPGHLFTKDELFATVWAGRVVTDSALTRAVQMLRSALHDDATAPRYIATTHGIGFRFIAPVSFDTAALRARRAPLSAGPGLVGRDEELQQLDLLLSAAAGGQRQIVFVTGEAGIGKTALVEAHLERHRADPDVLIAQGRCVEQYGSDEAYLPLLEALEQLSLSIGVAEFRAVFKRYAPQWLAQLAWLAHDDERSAQVATDDSTPRRMLRELAQALEVLSVDRTVVLWLEDLHWSDRSSLAVLSFLAGRRDAARLVVIGSFRPSEARLADAPLYRLSLQLSQRGQARELALAALSAEAVTAYLGRHISDEQGELRVQLGACIHARTDGNALFIVAMVADLIAREQLARQDGTWTLRDSLAELERYLPDSVRRLVLDQYERLPLEDRRLIEAASVAGTDFNVAALSAAVECNMAEIEDSLNGLAHRGQFLRMQGPTRWPDSTVAAGFGFLHALFWQSIYEQVSLSRRVAWQLRIGLRLEQAYGEKCASVAAELAVRFEAGGDLARSVHYLQMAGASALERCAYPESISLLHHGLSLLPLLPTASRARRELDLLLPLGAALMALKGYADDEVDATYRRAHELSLACADTVALARVLRGQWNVAFIRAELNASRALAQELYTQAERQGNADLVLDAQTKLGQSCLHVGDLSGAQHHLGQALILSSASTDSNAARAAPRIAICLAWAQWFGGQAGEALSSIAVAVRLAAAAGSPHSSAFALAYGIYIYYQHGDNAPALALAPTLKSLTTEHGLSYWRQLGDFLEGMALARAGDPKNGSALMWLGLQAMRASGARVGIPYLLCLLAEVRLAGDDLSGARAALTDATTFSMGSANDLYAAEAERLAGDLALAECVSCDYVQVAAAHYERAIARARGQGVRAFELRAAVSLARLLSSKGEQARALEVLAPVHQRFEATATVDYADWHAATSLLDTLLAQNAITR